MFFIIQNPSYFKQDAEFIPEALFLKKKTKKIFSPQMHEEITNNLKKLVTCVFLIRDPEIVYD